MEFIQVSFPLLAFTYTSTYNSTPNIPFNALIILKDLVEIHFNPYKVTA